MAGNDKRADGDFLAVSMDVMCAIVSIAIVGIAIVSIAIVSIAIVSIAIVGMDVRSCAPPR